MKKIGLQLWTVRDTMDTAENIKETFKKVKDAGYDQIQTAGCQIPYAEFGQLAKDAGLEIVGTHDNFDMMVNDFEQSLANHKLLNTRIMGIGGQDYESLEDVHSFIEKANKVAENCKKNGMKWTYHNHSHEFIKWDGNKSAFDLLIEGLDPEVATFCLDTYWVQHGGGDVRRMIERLNGRIDILHLKDMQRKADGTCFAPIGEGNLYWEGIIDVAEKAGIKYYVVEQDDCFGEDPFECIKRSSDYLHKNFIK